MPEYFARHQLYGNPATPTVVFDGTDIVFEPNPDVFDSVFNQHIVVARSFVPSFNLNLTGSATASSGNLHIKINPADTLYHNSVFAYVAICEDSIAGMMRAFNYVVRKLYSFPVNLFFPDSLDTIINFTHSIPVNKMSGALFIQDMNTKKILQAIKTRF